MANVKAVTHYSIERELGRGAMGVVYLAIDTRLGRPVAIKTLPAEVANDPQRRERFVTEARTLAAINHPNIASIYGLEQQEGLTYLILEYVEGPTLTERIRPGPIEPLMAIGICRQVAAGIEAAHGRGIIHRDLKPENIKLRPDGVVKVLDFGIAFGHGAVAQAQSDSATIALTSPPSRSDIIIGTPGYMAPEQARGKQVTPVADVWSLGCVLYECLTGACAFDGESLADVLAATLHAEPDWSRLPQRTPARALELLRTSLDKSPDRRPQSMTDVLRMLDDAERELRQPTTIIMASSEADENASPESGNLAAPGMPLIGRDADRDTVFRHLRASRLVTIAGPAGSGRTSLALDCGASQRERFPGGVWHIDVPPVPDPQLPALAGALALGASGHSDPARAVAARIAARTALVVLTRCEHAPTPCSALIHTLMAACPNVRILAVARVPFGIRGEAVTELGPLSVPTPEEASTGRGRLDAARLFVERLRVIDGSFVSTADNTIAIADLCRRLGGWPLAIELAAALASATPISELSDRLEQRARLLGISGLGVLPAEGILRLLVRYMLDALPPAELAVFFAAAAFATPPSLRAICAASGARDSLPNPDADDVLGTPPTLRETRTSATLAKLRERSLLRWTDPGAHPSLSLIRMHPVVRHVAGEWLDENPPIASAVRMGHRSFIVAFFEQCARRWEGPAGEAWLTRAGDRLADLALAARNTPPDDPAAPRLAELFSAFRAARGF